MKGKRWEWGSGRVGWREDLMHAQVARLLLGEQVQQLVLHRAHGEQLAEPRLQPGEYLVRLRLRVRVGVRVGVRVRVRIGFRVRVRVRVSRLRCSCFTEASAQSSAESLEMRDRVRIGD